MSSGWKAKKVSESDLKKTAGGGTLSLNSSGQEPITVPESFFDNFSHETVVHGNSGKDQLSVVCPFDGNTYNFSYDTKSGQVTSISRAGSSKDELANVADLLRQASSGAGG